MLVRVYNSLPTGIQFLNPATMRNVELKGMNSHKLLTLCSDDAEARTPVSTMIESEDWEYFKTAYKDNTAFFNKFTGDVIFEAKDDQEARDIVQGNKPVFSAPQIAEADKRFKKDESELK